MTTVTCIAATLLAVLTIPLLILWRLSLTKQKNAKRLRNSGLSWAAVGRQLGVSGTTAKRWATA